MKHSRKKFFGLRVFSSFTGALKSEYSETARAMFVYHDMYSLTSFRMWHISAPGRKQSPPMSRELTVKTIEALHLLVIGQRSDPELMFISSDREVSQKGWLFW